MILPIENILIPLNEGFSRKIFPIELWNKIANGKQHFSVLFVKRSTGELRNITHATMNVSAMISRRKTNGGNARFNHSEHDLLFIRDNSQLDSNGVQGVPRSIPLENIIQIKCGDIYDFKKINNITYYFPNFKNSSLDNENDRNIIIVEGMKNNELKNKVRFIVERAVRKNIREDNNGVDISFIDKYIKRFFVIQQKYNNFFNSGNYSYVIFYNIMLEFSDLKREFEIYKNKLLNHIYNQQDSNYYNDLDRNNEAENKIGDITKDVEMMSDTIEQASSALKLLGDVPYTINIF